MVARLICLILLLHWPQAQAEPAARQVHLCAEDAWRPFSFVEKGEAVGANVEMARLAFQLQGYTVKVTAKSYPDCLQLTQAGQFDAMLDVAQNAERKPQFHWPQMPLLVIPLHLIGNANVKPAQHDYSALRGQRIGLTTGYEYPDILLKQPGIKKVFNSSELANFRRLQAGKIDYMLLSPGTLDSLVSQSPAPQANRTQDFGPIDQLSLFVAISRQSPQARELAENFDLAMKTLTIRKLPQHILQQWSAVP